MMIKCRWVLTDSQTDEMTNLLALVDSCSSLISDVTSMSTNVLFSQNIAANLKDSKRNVQWSL